ncbi:unnamed protein product [Vicia faba]|uniref:Myb/SANT-like domain-containing protein n=1 Tax=Vicia faba TaxID=3906 RepID=A0AAV0ZJE9_VICFA|nr:unnamed protein product [Vicia faba]
MSTSPAKATWNPAFHKVFVGLCLREVLKMNEPGARLTKETWCSIVESFYEKTGVTYDKKQFKNHYDSTRKLWKIWDKLTHDSSMKWDSETCKFDASEEDWCDYIKENPEAAQFQSKEILFKDELDIIFDAEMPPEEIRNSIRLKWQDNARATSLHGKGRGRKRKCVVRNYELNTSAIVNSTLTPKANWTPAYHKIFVDLCLDETLKGNKAGSHFTKVGWRNIMGYFYSKTGVRYDKRQIKNHYDSTRKQWKIWVKLIGDDIMKWDPETTKFGASEKEWIDYLKENPEAAQFRFKEILFPEKLDIIYGGDSIQTGEMQPSSSSERHKDDSGTPTPLYGKRGKKYKSVEKDFDFKSAILVNATPISAIASEQSISRSSHHKVKATWTPSLHKTFIDLCLQETLNGNKPGTHFTKEGWRNIMDSFHLKSGLNYGRLQFKNHWDSTKEQWRTWSKLVSTSYMKWNLSKHTFEASDEDWTCYLQANPEASQFRYKELQFPDALETIFNGTTVTGETEPAVQQKKSDDSVNTLPSHTKGPDVTSSDEKTEYLCDAVASRNGVSIQKNTFTISSAEGKRSYSIGECIECLDGMEDVEQGSDLYLFALDVFLRQEHREIFLQLKKPNLRISWLQRLQSVGRSSL